MTQQLTAEWTSPWVQSISKRLRDANGVDPRHIVIIPQIGVTVNEQATDEEIKGALNGLIEIRDRNKTYQTLLDRFIGQLIVAYAARHDCEWAQAISELDLVKETGKAFKTLVKLPRIVTVLPDEAFMLPGLTTSHFDAATSFGGPKNDPEKMAEFNEKRVAILEEASTNPAEYSKQWVSEKMRALQADMGVERSRPPGLNEVRQAYEITSLALIKWTDADYEAFGITRAELLDRWEQYRADMVDKDALPENETDPLEMALPWRSTNAIDVEFTHETTQEDGPEASEPEEENRE